MPAIRLESLDQPGIPPLEISSRLRGQLAYFASSLTAANRINLGENEYFFACDDVARILEDGVFHLVSPLDTAHRTEVELTEEQEALLEWLKQNVTQRVRVLE